MDDAMDYVSPPPKSMRSYQIMVWNPIETAPKDGTPMLLCWWQDEADVLPVTSGFWSRLSEHWFSETSGHKCNPTHWMPLPAPPAA
jgi:hypothetical protein